jgi:hypothetical protein
VGRHRRVSGSALLGLDGFRLVSAELVGGEWQPPSRPPPRWPATWAGVRTTPHGPRVRDCRSAAVQ